MLPQCQTHAPFLRNSHKRSGVAKKRKHDRTHPTSSLFKGAPVQSDLGKDHNGWLAVKVGGFTMFFFFSVFFLGGGIFFFLVLWSPGPLVPWCKDTQCIWGEAPRPPPQPPSSFFIFFKVKKSKPTNARTPNTTLRPRTKRQTKKTKQ